MTTVSVPLTFAAWTPLVVNTSAPGSVLVHNPDLQHVIYVFALTGGVMRTYTKVQPNSTATLTFVAGSTVQAFACGPGITAGVG